MWELITKIYNTDILIYLEKLMLLNDIFVHKIIFWSVNEYYKDKLVFLIFIDSFETIL